FGFCPSSGWPDSGQHVVQRLLRPAALTNASLDHRSVLSLTPVNGLTEAAALFRSPTCDEPSVSAVRRARSPLPSPLKSPATMRVSSHGIENGAKYAIPAVSMSARLWATLNLCSRTDPSPYQ